MPNGLLALQRLTRAINDKKTNKRFDETLKIAEKNKDPDALFLLGQNYLKEDNFKVFDLAYKYLKEASDLNHLEATYLLSDLLLNKLKRNEEGFEYCLKASERGHVIAARNLINLYAFGHGCERDEAKARRMANRVSLIYNSMLNYKNESNQNEKKNEWSFNMEKHNVENIESIIKIGRELCEFEEEESLYKDGLRYKDRLYRYFVKKFDRDCENRIQKSDTFMKAFKQFILNDIPDPKATNQVRSSIFDWMPHVQILAQKGK
jgi:TPR repeat protein